MAISSPPGHHLVLIRYLLLFKMEDSQFWYERVDELAAQGLLAPGAVLNTLTQMIERDVLDGEPELLYLRKALHSHGTPENGCQETHPICIPVLPEVFWLSSTIHETRRCPCVPHFLIPASISIL